MNEATRLAQLALDTEGYIVMAFSDGPEPLPKVGDILHGPIHNGPLGEVLGPVRVIGLATVEEYILQSERFNPYGAAYAIETAKFCLGFFKVTAE